MKKSVSDEQRDAVFDGQLSSTTQHTGRQDPRICIGMRLKQQNHRAWSTVGRFLGHSVSIRLGAHPSSGAGRRGSPTSTPKRRRKRSIAHTSRNAALWPLYTCSMRPRQRTWSADASRQKRRTKVDVGRMGVGPGIGLLVGHRAHRNSPDLVFWRSTSYLGMTSTTSSGPS